MAEDLDHMVPPALPPCSRSTVVRPPRAAMASVAASALGIALNETVVLVAGSLSGARNVRTRGVDGFPRTPRRLRRGRPAAARPPWWVGGVDVSDFANAARSCRMLGLVDATSLAAAVERSRDARLGSRSPTVLIKHPLQ